MASNNLRRLIKEAVTKEVDIPTSFVGDLKRTIIQECIKDNRKPSPTYKPSSLGCIRNMYFQRVEAEIDPPSPNPSLTGQGESGSARHEHLQRWITKMKENDIDCEYIDVKTYIEENGLEDQLEVLKQKEFETKIQHKTLHLRFLADGIIRYRGKYYILEIKTEVSFKWQTRSDVAPEHVKQGTAYATLFGLDDVLFLYENRDICDWKSYILHVTPEMKDELIIKPITLCEKYVQSKVVPPISKVRDTKTCKYCPYKTICKTTGNTEELFTI